MCEKYPRFWVFSKAGRDLAHWHLNYEIVEPYKAKLDLGGKSLKQLEDKDFYVTKMKFPKKTKKIRWYITMPLPFVKSL